MNISRIIKDAERVAVDNAPAILTGVAVVGTLTTAWLAGKASFSAAYIIADEVKFREVEDEPLLTPKEAVKLVWAEYLPAASTAVLTVVCIIGANRIGTRRAAALAAAYTVSERAFSEYREKVVEQHGVNKELKVRDAIAQDHVNANPPQLGQVYMTGNGTVLCMDDWTNQYFKSNMEDIKRAQNDLNYRMLSQDYASLADFYSMIGIRAPSNSSDWGWRSDNRLEISFHGTLVEIDGKMEPCMVMSFAVEPMKNYFKAH